MEGRRLRSCTRNSASAPPSRRLPCVTAVHQPQPTVFLRSTERLPVTQCRPCPPEADFREPENGLRSILSLRPFSRARALCGRSACLAPYGLGRPRPALRDRQPCLTIIDCGLRSQTADSAAHAQRAVLASADDRRRSTPMRRAAGTRPEPIPRGDSQPSDPWRSENPDASGAETYVVVTIP